MNTTQNATLFRAMLALNLTGYDDRTERNIATLHPKAQEKARAFMAKAVPAMQMLGYTVRIISGLRTYAEQEELYAQGRTKPGLIVTNARGGFSNHNFGIAFDVGIFNGAGAYIDDLVDRGQMKSAACEAAYMTLVPIGESVGETPGARWKTFQDIPHYELHPEWANGMSEDAMLAELRRRFAIRKDFFEV